jgi:hypothetical protein
MVKIYKKMIGNPTNNAIISKLGSDTDKLVAKYSHTNPRILLILDDIISYGSKDLNKSVEKIFYEGRHRNITIILATQRDVKIDKSIRDNAHLSIFCKKEVANSAIKKFDFDTVTLKEFQSFLRKVFGKDDKSSKAIYVRGD